MFFFDYIFPKAQVTANKNAPNFWHNLTLVNIVSFLSAKQLTQPAFKPLKGFLSRLSNL